MEKYLLGIDIGTQTSKGILISVEGQVAAQSNAEHATIKPHAGWLEHEADEAWWGDSIRIIRDILTQGCIDPKQIAGIGVSGCTPSILLIDAHNHPLRSAILYVDNRAKHQLDHLEREIGHPQPNLQIIAELTWLQENEPELWKKTYKILGAPGYVVCRLSGVYAIGRGYPDPLYNAKADGWDADKCRRFNIPAELLPDIHSPIDVVGKVSHEAAEQTGMAEGTPVICGCGDTYAEFVSTAVTDESEGAILYGTAMSIGRLMASTADSSSASPLPKFMARGRAGMATSGALTRWFLDNFASDEINEGKCTGIDAYKLIEMEANIIPPGSEGLIVLPYFNGERSPLNDPHARGMILGLTVKHTRLHIYHALLEGIAYGLRHNLDVMADNNIKPPALLRATGGGSQNELWTQIVSDVTGIPQDCVEGHYGAPLGDAFMAGAGVGIFTDYGEIGKWVRIERTVQPREQYKALYDSYYRIYRNLYGKNMDDMHELSRLST